MSDELIGKKGYQSLRAAVPADASEISRLVSELGYSASPAQIKDRLETLLSHERFLVLVAEATAGHLLGWINGEKRLSLEQGTTFEIIGLVVESGARRLGVGRALVSSIEAWAFSMGGTSIRVRSNVIRKESHDFYEASGYVRQKTQHAYMKVLQPRP